MDSKTVSSAIRRAIRPVLKSEGGFSKFTGRSAWRFDDQTVSVIHFQSFNSHLADGVGCTTFSFCVRLGVFYRYGRPESLPQEYDCAFRMTLGKSLRQPCFVPYASVGRSKVTDRPDVFFVAADGGNLDEAVADARQGLERRGLPALALFRDPSYAYRNLLDGDHVPLDYGGLEVSPPGSFDSPARRSATLDLGHLIGVADPRVDLSAARSRRSGQM